MMIGWHDSMVVIAVTAKMAACRSGIGAHRGDRTTTRRHASFVIAALAKVATC